MPGVFVANWNKGVGPEGPPTAAAAGGGRRAHPPAPGRHARPASRAELCFWVVLSGAAAGPV
ncbi:DUF6053 domain-containing protein [Lysobacter enzymogenes]|uniref:DUF6053 domain-containing protein n=2 Tax=Lysobacter TaxID=68 RepID=UPI003D18B2FF